ncbi:hypothetical protein [Sutcliffiella horikoshii]|uniref:hypothetical protein n=1 Tax=Sutcliffiella horikoshii TaxID=79883 RepID=UPI00384F9A97
MYKNQIVPMFFRDEDWDGGVLECRNQGIILDSEHILVVNGGELNVYKGYQRRGDGITFGHCSTISVSFAMVEPCDQDISAPIQEFCDMNIVDFLKWLATRSSE